MKVFFRRDILSFTNPLMLCVLLVFTAEAVMISVNVDTEKNTLFDYMLFGSMQGMIFSVLPLSLLGGDENAGWQKFSLTLPVRRHSYVSEKYIMTLCFIFYSTLLSSVGAVVLMAKTTGFAVGDYFLTLSVICGVVMLFMSLLLPLAFRFGTKKGIVLFVLVFVLLFVAGVSVVLWGKYSDGGKDLLNRVQRCDHLTLSLCIFVGAILIYTVSWLLSVRFYRSREF